MKTLNQKQLAHALFYSIKINDLDHAEYLLTLDAPVSTSYFINQNSIAYTPNLLAGCVASTIKQYGIPHAKSQQAIRVLNAFLQKQIDLKCHCASKNPHYCPISQVLNYLPFEDKDLLCEQNHLLLKLLYHGATYNNIHNTKDPIWNGIKELSQFLIAKKQQAAQLIKMNKNKIVPNRHSKCRNSKVNIAEL